ncbi:MAG: transglutaminase-like cysteine peptidase [Chromatiales bacterium]|nr:transglutaminase-like cysteine peptidase [Chromatiales bacterium]
MTKICRGRRLNSKRLRPLLLIPILWLGLAFAFADSIGLTDEVIAWVKEKYGDDAGLRVEAWRALMRDHQNRSEGEKLKLVNDFFNDIPYYSDQRLWGQEDYWATPIEALTRQGADCEDYSIAKYFTLREMGVADEKLRIMYVKALNLNQAHMVLTYYPTPTSIPKVLDNLNGRILSASRRSDLAPVYSFNADGLWLAKNQGKGKKVGSSGRLSLWQDLQKRMKEETGR